jgi:protein-disulfide isomerase/uncharacterized membrane protein
MEALKQYGALGAAAVLALAGFAMGPYAVMAWLAAAVLVCAGVVARSPRWGALSAAVLGFACSAYLFQLKLAPGKTSICDVSASVSCDVVNSSPASMIFGIPIAALGMGFFLGVAIAVLALAPVGSRLFQAVGLLAAVGCVYSVFLGFTAIQMGATCPMCMAIYAATALLLVSSLIELRRHGLGLLDGLGEVLKSPALLTIGATFLVVVVVAQGIYGSQDRRTDAERLMERMAENQPQPEPGQAPQPAHDEHEGHNHPPQPPRPAQTGPRTVEQELTDLYVRPRGALQLTDDEPILGDPNAPYVLVEYACFGCPHCAQAFGHLRALVEEMPDVQVRFRSFPLSNECNPVLPRGGRPEVCRGAMAARCAGNQGKFWDFAGIVFGNQQQLGDPLLAAAAGQVGLDYEKFSSCLADPATLERVVQDANTGVALQIQGTPTMLLKGVTDDGSWLELCGGADSAKALIQAKKQGMELLPAESRMCPLE